MDDKIHLKLRSLRAVAHLQSDRVVVTAPTNQVMKERAELGKMIRGYPKGIFIWGLVSRIIPRKNPGRKIEKGFMNIVFIEMDDVLTRLTLILPQEKVAKYLIPYRDLNPKLPNK